MAAGQLKKREIRPILYNALVIPGHLLTKRNLANSFGGNGKCPGLASHCTGLDRTLTPPPSQSLHPGSNLKKVKVALATLI